MSKGHVVRLILAASVLLSAPVRAQEAADPTTMSGDDHVREELGVNAFTTPSIEQIFRDLSALAPIPLDEVQRALPDGVYSNRYQLAMNVGAVIAEGFLAIQAEDPKRLEDVGRVLLKQTRALGVGDRVTSHSKGLLERAAKADWVGLRHELTATQTEVEKAMLELRDEEMAHMVALGGWMRALEIGAITVRQRYSPERAANLARPELFDYFIDRLDTLNPSARRSDLVRLITSQLKTSRSLLNPPKGKTIFESDVAQVAKLVGESNTLIAQRSETKVDEQE